MIVANHLLAKAGGLLHVEAEPDYRGLSWSCFDSGGVEIEVGEFLYGLVRTMKPKRILETGTRFGISAAFMGLALAENGRGLLTTIETSPTSMDRAKALFAAVGIDRFIEPIRMAVQNWAKPEGVRYEMIFLDTELQYRFGDLIRFWPDLNEGGIAIIHDLHEHMDQVGEEASRRFGVLPREIAEMIRGHRLQSLHLPTPRGLYLCQKASSQFHSTKLLETA